MTSHYLDRPLRSESEALSELIAARLEDPKRMHELPALLEQACALGLDVGALAPEDAAEEAPEPVSQLAA